MHRKIKTSSKTLRVTLSWCIKGFHAYEGIFPKDRFVIGLNF